MIGVKTQNAPTITLATRQAVNYDEAVKRYWNLVPVEEENTIDPAIIPEGRRYDLELDLVTFRSLLFFSDNCEDKNKAIYLIAKTDNRTVDHNGTAVFTRENRDAYEKLQKDRHNPLFGLWFDEKIDDEIVKCLDTSYVEKNADDKEAEKIKYEMSQTGILKINPDGKPEMI